MWQYSNVRMLSQAPHAAFQVTSNKFKSNLPHTFRIGFDFWLLLLDQRVWRHTHVAACRWRVASVGTGRLAIASMASAILVIGIQELVIVVVMVVSFEQWVQCWRPTDGAVGAEQSVHMEIVRGQRQRWLLIVAIALLLLLGRIIVHLAENVLQCWRHPIEILLQVAASALATACLEHQIVTLFGPQILLALAIGPWTSPSDRLQIGEHTLFPGLEAFAMHVLAGGALLIAANDANAFAQIVHVDQAEFERVQFEAIAGRHTASCQVVGDAVVNAISRYI